jgi:hypothetical protein
MEKITKSFAARQKKERKTIKDGEHVLSSINNAIKDGMSAYGFTMGKVSLVQIVESLCKEFGGNFELSTCIWSANKVDILRLKHLEKKGLLKSARFIVDPSAYTRKYDAIETLYECFGVEAVRTMPTHAKFVTLKSATRKITITSSMNFTHNPRIEQYDVVECEDTLDLMEGVVDCAFEEYSSDDNFTGQAMAKFAQIKRHITEVSEQDGKIDLDLDLDLDLDFL